MLLEAHLIQSNQPKFNILLKSGQPFLYLFFTLGKLPEIKIVRNQKQKGTYFGPFLDKGATRKMYDFFIKTFRLKLCKKKIINGCLDYHLGFCAGICRSDFDAAGYQERLLLVRLALAKNHKVFLHDLMEQIQEYNKKQEFEHAQELYRYYTACQAAFSYLDISPLSAGKRIGHDIWILTKDKKSLHILIEHQNVLTLKQSFYFPFDELVESPNDYFIGYYRSYKPSLRILINFDLSIATCKLYQKFLTQWHHIEKEVTIFQATRGHEAALIRYGVMQVNQLLLKKASLGKALKQLLKLSREPRTIDCFDISHQQGMFNVGACVRFTDGQPDKKFFRHFYIKTVQGQNDYASLAEIVSRRYRDNNEVPDLIVVDGGKWQLSAVLPLIPIDVDVISLAKREETIFSSKIPMGIHINTTSFAGQMLIALRDYTHHFAINFHRKRARESLDKDR